MSRRKALEEAIDLLDMETYLDWEGITYRETRGSRGYQLNVKECPVCGNNKWKVYLNKDTGLGNCFAGDHPPGENFNKFSFIRAHLGNPSNRVIIDHILTVSGEMGWRPKKITGVAVDDENLALVLPESRAIPIDERNLLYLESRGIDADTASYFNLRYSHTGKFHYTVSGENREQDYSRRVIIPVFDLEGKLVSFQGRDVTGTAEKKYLFPPGFASTGKYLYNGHNALGAESVVVGEGAFDVIAIKLAFDEDMALRDIVPIGTFGKHLSAGEEGKDQLAQFLELGKRGLKTVTFMWDGEPAAIDAAISSALLLHSYGFATRIAILPEGADPNEVSQQVVRDAFWKAITINKISAIRMKLDIVRKLKASASNSNTESLDLRQLR